VINTREISLRCCHLTYNIYNLRDGHKRETIEGFEGGLQIGGRRISNLRYADDIV